jgi:hypothetical protein
MLLKEIRKALLQAETKLTLNGGNLGGPMHRAFAWLHRPFEHSEASTSCLIVLQPWRQAMQDNEALLPAKPAHRSPW